MKNICLCLFYVCLPFGIIAQKHLQFDTCFYSNGGIKSIKYNLNERGRSAIRYFKLSDNSMDRNCPIIDTMYSNDFANSKDWTRYEGSIIIYGHHLASVFIEKDTKTTRNFDSCYKKIEGTYIYQFPDFGNLELTLVYTKDSLISVLFLNTIDLTKIGGKITDVYLRNRYSKGLKFKSGDIGNIFDCGKLGSIELIFDNHNILYKFCFYPKNNTENATEYTFYPTFFCKSVGHTINKRLNGIWYEYHPNGNIKNFGEYAEISIDNKVQNVKNGKWQYFDEHGKLILVEIWDNGKLLK